jgi:hypothetical protein
VRFIGRRLSSLCTICNRLRGSDLVQTDGGIQPPVGIEVSRNINTSRCNLVGSTHLDTESATRNPLYASAPTTRGNQPRSPRPGAPPLTPLSTTTTSSPQAQSRRFGEFAELQNSRAAGHSAVGQSPALFSPGPVETTRAATPHCKPPHLIVMPRTQQHRIETCNASRSRFRQACK